MYQPFNGFPEPTSTSISFTASNATGFDIDALLAFHKAKFGDARMADDGGDGGDGGAGDGGDGGAGDGGAPQNNTGYPADTPVKDMSVEQQAAYWKAQSQKHEKVYKSKFGDITPEQLTALREKADAHDALERELMSDRDRAILEAKETATAEANVKVAGKLVQAEFKSAAAGRLDGDRLKALMDGLDTSKFVNKDGDVDEAKVAAFIDSVAPKAATPKGPSSSGLGTTPHTPGEPGAQGKAMAEKRFGKAAVS